VGRSGLVLWATSGNEAAIALYRRCGFQPTGMTRSVTHTPSLKMRSSAIFWSEVAFDFHPARRGPPLRSPSKWLIEQRGGSDVI
jgi:hypothetical protein